MSAYMSAEDFAKCSFNSFNQYAMYPTSEYNQYASCMEGQWSPPSNTQAWNPLLALEGYSDDSDNESVSEAPIAKPILPKLDVSAVTEPKEEEAILTPTSNSTMESLNAESKSPIPSSCGAEPDLGYLSCESESEAEEKVQDTDSDSLPGDAGDDTHFTVTDLMKMRHSIPWVEGLLDRPLTAQASETSESGSRTDESPRAANAASEMSWRSDSPVGETGKKGREHRKSTKGSGSGSGSDKDSGSEELMVGESSWLAQQLEHRRCSNIVDAREKDAKDVVRKMKSILNKLTIEKFTALYEKLLSCGISTRSHLDVLFNEIFDKAANQHHFINMYADLCARLVSDGVVDKSSFKDILSSVRQSFSDRGMKTPVDLDGLSEDDKAAEQNKYKMQTLGSIKFVGALLVRELLVADDLVAMCEKFLVNSTPEDLESLAALLSVVGQKFDSMLSKVFQQVQELVQDKKLNRRVCCLLKDLLELRAARWQDRKPKQADGPSTLKEVAEIQAEESPKWSPPPPTFGEESPKNHGRRSQGGKTITRDDKNFDKEASFKEIWGALAELRVSHEAEWALLRIAALDVPASCQAKVLCEMLAYMAEEGSATVRKMYFEMCASLFTEGHWERTSLANGLQDFLEEICPNLKEDIPALSQICWDELQPILGPLVSKGRVIDAPCRFFCEGRCTKGAACQFKHELPKPGEEIKHFISKQPCKFFQKRRCTKGADCLFSHDKAVCAVESPKGDRAKRER